MAHIVMQYINIEIVTCAHKKKKQFDQIYMVIKLTEFNDLFLMSAQIDKIYNTLYVGM